MSNHCLVAIIACILFPAAFVPSIGLAASAESEGVCASQFVRLVEAQAGTSASSLDLGAELAEFQHNCAKESPGSEILIIDLLIEGYTRSWLSDNSLRYFNHLEPLLDNHTNYIVNRHRLEIEHRLITDYYGYRVSMPDFSPQLYGHIISDPNHDYGHCFLLANVSRIAGVEYSPPAYISCTLIETGEGFPIAFVHGEVLEALILQGG